jgi:hypothetical protein
MNVGKLRAAMSRLPVIKNNLFLKLQNLRETLTVGVLIAGSHLFI